MSHVGPLIEAQLAGEKEYGKDWPEKTVSRLGFSRGYSYYSPFALQNNLISWLLEEAQGSQRTVRELTVRILECKSHAPSASSVAEPLIHLQAFTDIVFDLAAHPEYVAPMREEVEAIIEAEGWTKPSIGKMHKVDSFVKESQRIGIGGSTFSFPEPPQINDS